MNRFIGILILIALLSFLVSIPSGNVLLATGKSSESLTYVESSDGLIPPNLEAGPIEVEMGDVNRDGNPDLISIGDHYGGVYEEQGIMVWFGDGTGHWSWTHVGENFGYGGIALGDVNNDGLMDVGYGMHHNNDGELGDQLLEVALGDGTGLSWIPYDDGLAVNGESWGMFGTDFADVDNDGDLDLGSTSFGCCNGIHIYLNQADGSWDQSWSTLEDNGFSNDQFTFGDVNGDGNADLAVNYEYGSVYLGDGTGSFTSSQGNLPPSAGILSTAFGEVNHDGRDEIGLITSSGAVQVWSWLSPGTWQNISGSLPTSGPYEAIQLHDMNMDGNGDVIAFGTGQVRIWAGDGAGEWSEISSFTTPAPGYAQAFRVGVDVDHNGYPDIVLVSDEGSWPSSQNHLRFYKEASSPSILEIKPVAPTENKYYHAGSIVFVDWVSSVPGGEAGTVSLELSIHGPDGPWAPVANDLPDSGRYQWLIPDGTLSTDQALIRYTLTIPGETVTSVTPAAFHILGSTQEPISGLSAFNDGPTVWNETTILSATIISGTDVTYAWDLGDGSITTGAIVNLVYPDVGVYTATVTASNAVSNAQAMTVVEVYEDPIFNLLVSTNNPTVLGETTILTATIISGTNVLYNWDLGDGSTATGAVVSHVYPGSGVYTATVTASNSVSELIAMANVLVLPPQPAWKFWLPVLWRGGG